MSTAAYPARFEPLVEATRSLAERFAAAGRRLYLVGGSVRDALLDAELDPAGPSDLDLTTDALPDEIESLLKGWADAVWTQGKRFGTIGATHGGRTYEITTHRTEHYLPELPGLEVEQDPIHQHKDVLAHTLAVVDKTSPDRLLRLSALFHDVGKPKTRAFTDGGVSFHHHEVVGARMTRQRMKALKYSNDDIETVVALVELHLRFHTYRLGWTDKAVRRYVRDAGEHLDRLNELTRCDCTTRNASKARALARRMDELEERIAELRAQEELDAIRPDLDGAQVMSLLGIGPGRQVGEALGFLLELRMDEGPLGEEEAARRLVIWWEARESS